MGTLAGAEALGIASEYGSITPGKRAALAVVPLSSDTGYPVEQILRSDAMTARVAPLAI
jgi:cytosine/adenosine deaminase-related metal-dependent hydrolase